jgi:hypothetical protein
VNRTATTRQAAGPMRAPRQQRVGEYPRSGSSRTCVVSKNGPVFAVQHRTVAQANSLEDRNTKDLPLQCQFNLRHCVGDAGIHSVCRAAAASVCAHATRARRRLEDMACKHWQRGAGSDCCAPAGTTGLRQALRFGPISTSRPNPSVNRSANGRPPRPGRWYAVHFHRPGRGGLPSSPGYLER